MVQLTSSSIDRGWAWLIMLGCFINILTNMTFIRSLSIFFLTFLDKFQQSATMTTLSFSINTISFSIGSIIVPTVLLPRFSVRLVTLVGAILSSASIIGMAFSPNMIYIHISFCILGLGHPLMFISQTTLMGVYFKKKLSFALAFANLGLSIATMVGPPFTHFLLETYGLQGAILIHGGLTLHNIVACMLFLPAPVQTSLDDDGEKENETLLEKEADKEFTKLDNIDTKLRGKSNLIINTSNHLSSVNDSTNPFKNTEECKKNDLIAFLKSKTVNPIHGSLNLLTSKQGKDSLRSESDLRRPMNGVSQSVSYLVSSRTSLNQMNRERSITFASASIVASDILSTLSISSNSIHRLNDVATIRKSEDTGPSYDKVTVISLHEMTNRNTDKDLQKTTVLAVEEIKSKDKQNEQFLSQIKDLQINNQGRSKYHLNVRSISKFSRWLHRFRESPISHPTVWLLILASGFGINTQCGASYMPSLGKEQGVQPSSLPFLMTAIGASDLLKLAIGYIADKNLLKRIHIVCLTQLIVGVAFQFAGQCHGLVPMFVFAIVFGSTTGTFHVLLPGITVDLLGVSYIGHVMSGYFLVNGAVMSSTHVLVGLLKDNTGSFIGAYHFIGSMMLTGMLLLLLEPLVRKLCLSKQTTTDKPTGVCIDEEDITEQVSLNEGLNE